MFIWLADGWCTSHSSLYTHWQCQTWNQYILKLRIRKRGTPLWLNPNVAVLCWCHAVAGLSSWNNYSSYNSPFVRRDDTLSSSLCHVQSPCSSRPQIGCLSNAECFDKWLCLYTSLKAGRCRTTFSWCWVTTCGLQGVVWILAIRTGMIRVYMCNIHSIHSIWLCLYPEVPWNYSCSIT